MEAREAMGVEEEETIGKEQNQEGQDGNIQCSVDSSFDGHFLIQRIGHLGKTQMLLILWFLEGFI